MDKGRRKFSSHNWSHLLSSIASWEHGISGDASGTCVLHHPARENGERRLFLSPVSRYKAELPNLNPGCERDEPPGEHNNKKLHHLLLAFRSRSRSAPTACEQCPEGGAHRQKGDGIIHQNIHRQIDVKVRLFIFNQINITGSYTVKKTQFHSI